MFYDKILDLPESVSKRLETDFEKSVWIEANNRSLKKGKSATVANALAWGVVETMKAEGKKLYGKRPVLNSEEIVEWARSQGFDSVLYPDDLHTTVLSSRRPIYFPEDKEEYFWSAKQPITAKGGSRWVLPLGNRVYALVFDCPAIVRDWLNFREEFGASWDFPSFIPHITLTYKGDDLDLETIEPFREDINFGPVEISEFDDNMGENVPEFALNRNGDNATDKTGIGKMIKSATRQIAKAIHVSKNKEGRKLSLLFDGKIEKVDEEQRIVWGWASVSTVNGQLVTDAQGDVIEPDEMMKAANEFMKNARSAKVMHKGTNVGVVLHSLPLTKELAKALDIESDVEGWVIGMRVDDDQHWESAKKGDYTGFSIGGRGKRYALR